MLLFDSNPMHPLNQLSFECQKYILALTMVQFREFPLCSGSYNEEKIRFYDGVLGNLIRTILNPVVVGVVYEMYYLINRLQHR